MSLLSSFVPAVLAFAGLATAQSGNPLNDFIGEVNSAAAVINSWNDAQATAGPSAASSLSSAASSAQSVISTAASSVRSAVSESVKSATSSLASTTTSNSASDSTSDTASSTASSTTSNTAAASTDNSSGGMDPHTRTIIIAVCVVVGVLLLALLAFLCFCCCRRRRSKRAGTPLTDEGADWDEHPANPHHSFASSHGVTHAGKRYSDVNSMSQRDSAPLMSGAIAGHNRNIDNSQHPAYRTNDPHAYQTNDPNAYRTNDPNASNPFTPTPPVRRKPIPISTAADKNHSHSTALAAGVAGAAIGGAAMHHHDKKNHTPSPRQSNPSTPTLPPIQETSPTRGLEEDHERNPNRPPTPFGLGALGGFGNSRKSGEIEPTVADHYHGPTDEQRRSLNDRERRFSWNPDDDPGSPHSDTRNSLTAPLVAAPAAAAVAGGSNARHRAHSGTLHDSTYASNTDSSSGESWKSAQMGPQLGGLYDDNERRHSADYFLANRSYGDRGSAGVTGQQGKRLRFSDEMPLQLNSRYGDTPWDGSYDAGRYGGYSRGGGGGGYGSGVGQAY